MLRVLFAIILGMAVPAAAWAQTPTPQSDPGTDVLADVVVEARRTEEQARSYVDEVAAPPRGTRVARWNREICISVTGMDPRYAQFIIDRVARTALDLGAEVGGPGCRPNVIILATDDGAKLANELVDRAGLGFQPSINGTNLPPDALNHFRTSNDPVRWWHISMPVSVENGALAITLRGDTPLFMNVRRGSRLRSNVRYDLGWVVIIVDLTKTNGAPFGALADYIAFPSLAQVDARADLSGQNTVLNLFRQADAPTGLTDWDRDYLRALYTTQPDRMTVAQQIRDLTRSLVQVRRSESEPPAE